jgi:Uma2 family endonuclease
VVIEPAPHLFTVDEYEAMGRAGVFPVARRLELLGGEILEMTPIGSPHASTVKRLNRLLVAGLGDRAIIGVQDPVVLNDMSELQPDLAVLRPRADFYGAGHPRPEDVLLVIEVADTTGRWDRTVKRPLYAAAGVAEVWIVDLTARVIEVALEPEGDGYRSVRQVGVGAAVSPAAFPGLSISVSDLLV